MLNYMRKHLHMIMIIVIMIALFNVTSTENIQNIHLHLSVLSNYLTLSFYIFPVHDNSLELETKTVYRTLKIHFKSEKE